MHANALSTIIQYFWARRPLRLIWKSMDCSVCIACWMWVFYDSQVIEKLTVMRKMQKRTDQSEVVYQAQGHHEVFC